MSDTEEVQLSVESADALLPKETVINSTQLRALLLTVRVDNCIVLPQFSIVVIAVKSVYLIKK